MFLLVCGIYGIPIIRGVYTIYAAYGICCLRDPGGPGVTVGDCGGSFVGVYVYIYIHIFIYQYLFILLILISDMI